MARAKNLLRGEMVDRLGHFNQGLADLSTALKPISKYSDPVSASLDASHVVLPVLKLVVEILKKVTALDFPDQAYFACYSSYLSAAWVELARKGVAYRNELGNKFIDFTNDEAHDFEYFGYENAGSHSFIRASEAALEIFANENLNHDTQKRHVDLKRRVLVTFVETLKAMLERPETRLRFTDFAEWMKGDRANRHRARADLDSHVNYQVSLFEERKVNGEGFPLAGVYTKPKCAVTRCTDQAVPEVPSTDLLGAVVKLLESPTFEDAIVIQGPPGSGKTAFTLELTRALRAERAMHPIRIVARDIDVTSCTFEGLARAIYYEPRASLTASVFDEPAFGDWTQKFGDVEISPYVLILDGWDELQAKRDGKLYELEIEPFFRWIRDTFLSRHGPCRRVILTGRCVDVLERAQFMYKNTVLLTLRPFEHDQIREFADKLAAVTMLPPALLRAGLGEASTAPTELLCGLSWPLHVHRALSLASEAQRADLFEPDCRAVLYRALLRELTRQAGKPIQDHSFEPKRSRALCDPNLTRYLRALAVRMYQDNVDVVGDEQAMMLLDAADRDHLRLLTSFWFASGPDRVGIRFTDPWMQTVLLAERIVELLVEHCDERRSVELITVLAPLLGVEWLASNLRLTLSSLLREEFERSFAGANGARPSSSGEPWSRADWQRICGGLVHAWSTWTDEPRWFELARTCPVVMVRSGADDARSCQPLLAIQFDARVGDGLFFLVSTTCTMLASADVNFVPMTWPRGAFTHGVRRRINIAPGRPGGDFPAHANIARAALEGSDLIGLSGADLTHAKLSHAQLQRANLSGADLAHADASGAQLAYANLTGARLDLATFDDAVLMEATLKNASCVRTSFLNAGLERANLEGCNLMEANLSGARLEHAKLDGASLERIHTMPEHPVDLREAELRGASLARASLQGATLKNAKLTRANMVGAELHKAVLANASLEGADLRSARLISAILDEANLKDAILSEATLIEASLIGASLAGAVCRSAEFSLAKLGRADFSDAVLPFATLVEANLVETTLINVDLRSASLEGATLTRATLTGARLTDATLIGADFTEADLVSADLRGAKLERAVLRRANLERADLRGANLERADLCDANLQGTDLRGVEFDHLELNGADLRNATFDPDARARLEQLGVILYGEPN